MLRALRACSALSERAPRARQLGGVKCGPESAAASRVGWAFAGEPYRYPCKGVSRAEGVRARHAAPLRERTCRSSVQAGALLTAGKSGMAAALARQEALCWLLGRWGGLCLRAGC
jgi:hypothetical protein